MQIRLGCLKDLQYSTIFKHVHIVVVLVLTLCHKQIYSHVVLQLHVCACCTSAKSQEIRANNSQVVHVWNAVISCTQYKTLCTMCMSYMYSVCTCTGVVS